MVKKLITEMNLLVKILEECVPLIKGNFSEKYQANTPRTIDYECDDGTSSDCDSVCNVSKIYRD